MAKPKTGAAQVNVELPTAFLDDVRAFGASRGEKLRDTFYHALRRHLTYPPATTAEPPPEPPGDDVQVNVELPTEFLDDVKAFAKARGEKLRQTCYHALQRHLQYPPPPPPPLPTEPFPDSPAAPDTPKERPRTARPKKG